MPAENWKPAFVAAAPGRAGSHGGSLNTQKNVVWFYLVWLNYALLKLFQNSHGINWTHLVYCEILINVPLGRSRRRCNSKNSRYLVALISVWRGSYHKRKRWVWNIQLMSIFQFVELEVRFDSDTSLCGARSEPLEGSGARGRAR